MIPENQNTGATLRDLRAQRDRTADAHEEASGHLARAKLLLDASKQDVTAAQGLHAVDLLAAETKHREQRALYEQWVLACKGTLAEKRKAARALKDFEEAAKLVRQAAKQQKTEVVQRLASGEAEEAIQRAFAATHPGRTWPYTPEELAEMAPTRKRWLLETKAGTFIRAPGGDYVHVTKEQIQSKARDLLAPASTDGVVLATLNEDGEKRLSGPELVTAYGQSPTKIEYSYVAPRCELREVDDTFVQRVAQIRPELRPIYSAEIEKYLELLGGDKHELLLDWLATLTDLNRYSSALWVLGAAGIGKGMFVEGCARLWSTAGAVGYGDASGKFNAELRDCPLVCIDEKLDAEFGDKQPLDGLKRFITATSRQIADKNVRAAKLAGATRVILTSNNVGLLRAGRQLGADDIDALDQRLLLVSPHPSLQQYLQSLGNFEATGPWIEEDIFAEHILHLTQTRKVQDTDRFRVQGSGVREILSSDSNGQREVLDACLRGLVKGLIEGEYKGQAVCVASVSDDSPRHVWVYANALREHWKTLGDGDSLPSDLESVLNVVCARNESAEKGNPRVRYQGERQRRRQVQTSLLLRRAQALGCLADFERLGIHGVAITTRDEDEDEVTDISPVLLRAAERFWAEVA